MALPYFQNSVVQRAKEIEMMTPVATINAAPTPMQAAFAAVKQTGANIWEDFQNYLTGRRMNIASVKKESGASYSPVDSAIMTMLERGKRTPKEEYEGQGIVKQVGAIGGAVADLSVGLFEAGFAFLNAVDEEGQSIISPFLNAANFSFEFLGQLGYVPKSAEEYDASTASTAGRIAGKLRDDFWNSVFWTAEAITGQEIADTSGKFYLNEVSSVTYKSAIEDVINESLGAILTIGAFGMAGRGAKSVFEKVNPNFGEMGTTAKTRIDAYQRYSTPLEKDPEGIYLLATIDDAVRNGDMDGIDFFKRNEPKAWNEYVSIKERGQDLASKYVELMGKRNRGEDISVGERKYMVDLYSKSFRGDDIKVPGVNELLASITKSQTKYEFFDDVMADISSSVITHPKVQQLISPSAMPEFGMTLLKSKEVGSMRDPMKFAQMTGGEAKMPEKPTGEVSAEKVQLRQMKATGAAKKIAEERGLQIDERGNMVIKEGKTRVPVSLKLENPNAEVLKFMKAEDAESVYMNSPQGDKAGIDFGEFLDTYSNSVFDMTTGDKIDIGYENVNFRGPISRRGDLIKERMDIETGELKEGNSKISDSETHPAVKAALEEPIKKIYELPRSGQTEKFQKSPVVGKFFQKSKMGFFKSYIQDPDKTIYENILTGDIKEKFKDTVDNFRIKEHEADTFVQGIELSLLEDFEVPKGVKEVLFKNAQMKYLGESSERMFKAKESGDFSTLSGKEKDIVNMVTNEFNRRRSELVEFEKVAIKKRREIIDRRNDEVKKVKKFIDANEELPAPVYSKLMKVIDEHEEIIDTMNRKIKMSEDHIERLSTDKNNYVPHIIPTAFKDFVKTHFPDVHGEVSRGMMNMENKFLKARKDFPFYNKDLISATHSYMRSTDHYMSYNLLTDEMLLNASTRGFLKGTQEGDFINRYINQAIYSDFPGREVIDVSMEKLVDSVYGAYEYAKRFKDSDDIAIATKILEKKIVLTPEEAEYIRENAANLDEVKLSDDNVLTIKTLSGSSDLFQDLITGLKLQGYAGTIGWNVKTTAINITDQPLTALAFAFSGKNKKEGLALMKEVYPESFKSWGRSKDAEAFREELRSSGLAPKAKNILSGEAKVDEHRGFAQRFYDFALMNMEYSEYIARYSVGRIGAEAYKRGLISAEDAGKIVTLKSTGKDVALGFSDKFNLRYGPAHTQLWMGTPLGRVMSIFGTYPIKMTARYVDLIKSAEFGDWMKKSHEIVRDRDLSWDKKAEMIFDEYQKNYSRMGFSTAVIYKISLAMALGQVFDMDWNEFLNQGVSFSVSNPITNLILGAGGFDQGFIQNSRNFIPFRGGIRTLDKFLGTDLLDDYRDYGNIPQIKDLFTNE